MAPATLLLDALLLILTGALYAYVGRVTLRRRVEGDGHLAARLFSVFWLSLAGIQALSAAGRIFGWVGILDVPLFVTITYVALLGICVAFWALDYYLFYLLLGTRRVLWPLSVFYVGFYAYFLYLVTTAHPIGVTVGAWTASLEYEHSLAGSPAALIAGLMLIIPPFIGALGYSRLFFKVVDPTQRYRIGLVSITIAVWMGVSLLATSLELNTAPWWQLVSRTISLLAALVIYAAYRPPGWVRRRWGIEAVEEANAA